MARLISCGFGLRSAVPGVEGGVVNGAANLSFDTSLVPYAGAVALRGNSVLAAANQYFPFASSDQSNKLYVSFWLYLANLVAATFPIVFLNSADAAVASVTMNSNGTLNLKDAGGGSATTTKALVAGRYYHIEVLLDATTNPGALELRVNGATWATRANTVQGSYAAFNLGNGSSVTLDFRIAGLIVNDSTGVHENSWVGGQRLYCMRPLAAGDANAWLNTSGGAGAATDYGLVSEAPPDDATSFIQSVTLNAEDLFKMYADTVIPSDATITCVSIGARFRNDTADATTAFLVEVEKASAGTKGQSAPIVPNSTTWRSNNAGVDLATLGHQVYPAPLVTYLDPDGAAWTGADLPTLQAGVKLSAAGTNKAEVTALWGYVSYVPKAKTGLLL